MKTIHAVLAVAVGGLIASSGSAKSPQPRISMSTARSHALTYVPHGRIASAELETERGRLIYSFDIKVPNRPGIEEIQISAITGKLVSHTHESPAVESRERRSEPKEHQ